jgi:hypothetical protein
MAEVKVVAVKVFFLHNSFESAFCNVSCDIKENLGQVLQPCTAQVRVFCSAVTAVKLGR